MTKESIEKIHKPLDEYIIVNQPFLLAFKYEDDKVSEIQLRYIKQSSTVLGIYQDCFTTYNRIVSGLVDKYGPPSFVTHPTLHFINTGVASAAVTADGFIKYRFRSNVTVTSTLSVFGNTKSTIVCSVSLSYKSLLLSKPVLFHRKETTGWRGIEP